MEPSLLLRLTQLRNIGSSQNTKFFVIRQETQRELKNAAMNFIKKGLKLEVGKTIYNLLCSMLQYNLPI